MTGKGITETSNQVKQAIQEVKVIITQGNGLETSSKSMTNIQVQGTITEQQQKVLELRCVQKESFAAIAKELNLSQKEVHTQFMAAYKLLQHKHQQQLESV